MVMASAGVNMPGAGDGNPAAATASPSARQGWLLRRRRRLAPPRAAAANAGSELEGSSRRRGTEKRPRSASPSSPSSSSSSLDEDSQDEEEQPVEEQAAATAEEEGEGTHQGALAPVAAPAGPPQVWLAAFGNVSLVGRQREMEDTVSIHPSFCLWADGSPMHYFAVFDGHGGALVSEMLRDQMHLFLAEELRVEAVGFLQRRREREQSGAAGGGGGGVAGTSAAGGSAAVADREEEERAWRAAVHRTFRRADALASLACACGRLARRRCGCPLAGTAAGIVGSTAVVAVLAGGRVLVANCGDSRAVLCQGPGQRPPVPLSDDHKPDRPDEYARIQSVGGRVLENNGQRVRGILAMSRALGDRFLRPEVISVPEITITDRTVDDECLILASDGMWDTIKNDTACNVARHCLQDVGADDVGPAGPEPLPDARCFNAATLLARLAIGRGSMDNVSVIVIDLKRRG